MVTVIDGDDWYIYRDPQTDKKQFRKTMVTKENYIKFYVMPFIWTLRIASIFIFSFLFTGFYIVAFTGGGWKVLTVAIATMIFGFFVYFLLHTLFTYQFKSSFCKEDVKGLLNHFLNTVVNICHMDKWFTYQTILVFRSIITRQWTIWFTNKSKIVVWDEKDFSNITKESISRYDMDIISKPVILINHERLEEILLADAFRRRLYKRARKEISIDKYEVDMYFNQFVLSGAFGTISLAVEYKLSL